MGTKMGIEKKREIILLFSLILFTLILLLIGTLYYSDVKKPKYNFYLGEEGVWCWNVQCDIFNCMALGCEGGRTYLNPKSWRVGKKG